MAGRRTHRLSCVGEGLRDSAKKKMLEDFSRSIFWQHREKFCEPIADEQLSRQVIDAYLIFCLGRYMTINSYCEIEFGEEHT